MAKIVINKNFQSKYLYRAYERLVKPDYSTIFVGGTYFYFDSTTYRESTRGYYKNLSSGLTTSWSGIQEGVAATSSTSVTPFMLCTETYLTVLNKINKALKNNTLPNVPTKQVAGSGFTKTLPPIITSLVDTLFSSNVTVRNNGYKYFLDAGIITSTEYNYIVANTSGMRRLSSSNVNNTSNYPYVYDAKDNVTSFSNSFVNANTNEVLRLDTPYFMSSNTNNEQLYLVVIPFCDARYSNKMSGNTLVLAAYFSDDISTNKLSALTNGDGPTGAMFQYTTFHDKATNTVVNQIPYIALSITEVGMGGDIEFDHLDEIEYLDEIKISIALPKEYV